MARFEAMLTARRMVDERVERLGTPVEAIDDLEGGWIMRSSVFDLARFTIVEKLGDESIGGVSLPVKPTCWATGLEDDPRFLGLSHL